MSVTQAEAGQVGIDRPTSKDPSHWTAIWSRLRENRGATVGAALITVFVMVAVLAPLLSPHSATAGDLSDIRSGFIPGPSPDHPLGLDHQGRDELSRLLHGARSSLVLGVAAVSFGVLFGLIMGGMAGACGGWVDTVVMRVMDVMLAIPSLLFAIGLAALLGNSLPSVMIAIGVGGVPIVARLIRGSMLSEREREYVVAARACGATRVRVVIRHILPNSVGPVLVAAMLALGGAILDAASLAFLGLGPNDPGTPEWGEMLAEGQRFLQTSPQLVFLPGAAIVVTVLGFNLVGDALREALDPTLDPQAQVAGDVARRSRRRPPGHSRQRTGARGSGR